MTKRVAGREIISSEDFFMAMAFFARTRSKDPFDQRGAVIVTVSDEFIAMDSNHQPKSIAESFMDWGKNVKNLYSRCAEQNAIDLARNSRLNLKGCNIYCTHMPCQNCMKELTAKEIDSIIYFFGSNKDTLKNLELTGKAGTTKISKYSGNLNWLQDEIKHMDNIGVFG